MAAGLPVVGTPVGGIPDFLFGPRGETSADFKVSHREQTGWFCQVNNPKSIAEQIKFILDPANSEQVKKITNQGRDLVLSKYTWDQVANQMRKIL
ncbi:MAG: hypothetical protein AAB453_00735, partial [Patescibacteria group bacterium]